MESQATTKTGSFFKAHILPVLFVFLIPAFSAWFFSYAERWMDRVMQEGLEKAITANRTISDSEKAQITAFHQAVPVSRIMASRNPQAAEMQAMYSSVSLRYAIFRWMKRIAWLCLVTVGVTFLIVGVSAAFARRSHAALYTALRIGWPVLRTSATIEVIGQAVLATALSFWVTAIFFESYFIKLIFIIGVLAVCAVFAVVMAIFSKTRDECEVSGELVAEEEAPALWSRLRELAWKLQTTPPDRVIVGIDPSFFVTEHPVVLAGRRLQGRTLYLSLPMLKVLSVDEAEAVLGHELAHFSGGDTFWSRKISPITARFTLYLRLLSDGLSVVVAHFMLAFWKLYSLSINRLSRAREFRADQLGSELVSSDAMRRALVKITCYCEYRAKTESGVFAQQHLNPELNLPLQIEQGYPGFLSAFAQSDTSTLERVPHPFDSHPTLANRLSHLGYEFPAALQDESLHEVPAESWYWGIATAPRIEQRMWEERQAAFQALHTQHLAWTLIPRDDEQVAIVTRLFPPLVFRRKDGVEAQLTFDRLFLSEWAAPIAFSDILATTNDQSFLRDRLTLSHRVAGQAKPKSTKLFPKAFLGTEGDLLANFTHYYSRHLTAVAANASSRS